MDDLFVIRLFRAAKFDVTLFQDLRSDKTALLQSIIVVALFGLMSGITTFITSHSHSTNILFISTPATVIFWFTWSYVTYLAGTKIFPTHETNSTFSEFVRVVGFTACPGIIPGFPLITGIWSFALMVIAVKTVLDYKSPIRAIAICMIFPFICFIFVIGFFILIFHDLRP